MERKEREFPQLKFPESQIGKPVTPSFILGQTSKVARQAFRVRAAESDGRRL